VANLQVAIARLTRDVENQATQLRKSRDSKGRADLRLAMESSHINLVYQIVDERPPPPPEQGKEFRLAMVGLACFLIFLPLCAVAVGAFDSRIHDPEDVQRLGLEVVGHVPRFPGFGVGSLRGRRAAERRRTGFRVT
jgi:capsular polysaccharide biosynthesis protein